MIRTIISNELLTALLVIGLIIVAIGKAVAPKRFEDFLFVIENDKYLKIYSRDQKFIDAFDILLFINLILSLAVFCYQFIQTASNTVNLSNTILLKLSIGLACFILIKAFFERLIARVFNIEKLIDAYVFQKISYKHFLGVVLLPVNAFILYAFKPSISVFYAIVILFILVNTVSFINFFKTHQTLLKNNLFYFILYLCALEIAPYVILYKVCF